MWNSCGRVNQDRAEETAKGRKGPMPGRVGTKPIVWSSVWCILPGNLWTSSPYFFHPRPEKIK